MNKLLIVLMIILGLAFITSGFIFAVCLFPWILNGLNTILITIGILILILIVTIVIVYFPY